ncbi:MAG: dihydroorotase [Burkholderiales bacterium]|nr:dihydroorotase [Burkholderiales bacterium]
MTTLILTKPDDMHLHLRDGDAMRSILPHTVRRFARAIVMPNLRPPIATTAQAIAYRERILSALPPESAFEPLMTLYLTDNTAPAEIVRARESGVVHAVKYYPAGATTNSDSGVTDIARCHGVLEAMERTGLPLLVHGEVTAAEVDVFDRERVFIDQVLVPLVARFTRLKVVVEHITTREAVRFVTAMPANVAATITAHHLLLNRNALFSAGVRPHHYCLPILKREVHRVALVEAALSGNPKFFLGTDSAPHSRAAKECVCGCAGVYTAHAAIELYAEAFGANDGLDRLEAFASAYGAHFYGLARNRDSLSLERRSWQVPEELELGSERLVPFRAGESVAWSIV